MQKNRRYEIGVGILVLAAIALLAWMSLKVGAIHDLGEQVEVSAVFADAAGLTVGASVQVAGVEVGRVAGLAVEHDKARVRLSLRRDAGLRQDAKVRVRARSVLGEKYMEIRPFSREAPLIAGGEELATEGEQVEIDQLVNRLGPMVDAIDPEALNKVVGALAAAIEQDPERASRMLADLEVVLHNAALASAEAPALVSEARATLLSVRRVADDARPVVAHAGNLLTELDGTADQIPVTVEELRGLIGETRGAVADGRAMLGKVDAEQIAQIIDNLSEIDKWELRRLLREEGIVVRLREQEVVPTE